MEHKKHSLTPGILLIAIGGYFLLRQYIVSFSAWEQIYPIPILLLAGFLLWETYRNKKPETMFWGIFLLCIGAFFLLRNYELIPYLYFDEYWPVVLLALGIAFIFKFIVNPKEWGALIPGTILLFFGLKNMLNAFHEFYWDCDFFIDDLWPLIIIIVGIGIIISGIQSSKKQIKDDMNPH